MAITGVCPYNGAVKLFKSVRDVITKQPLVGDGALALLLAGSALLMLRAYFPLQAPALQPVPAMGLTLLAIIPLAVRRLFPVAALLLVTTAQVAIVLLNLPIMNFTAIAAFITIFTAAAYGGPRRNLACIACIVAMNACLTYKLMFSGNVTFFSSATLFSVIGLIWNLVIYLATWRFGNTLRLSREQTKRLRESAELLVREREENAHRAVFDERVRIARELHDVLAHHVSVMGIQAGAARQVLRQYPEKALNSLSLIETSSRQAVAELYRLLGLLRDERQAETFTARPGLGQLDKLVADMAASGLRVEVRIEGQKREIPQTVDLSAYRIVEEALTNTLKHAGPAKATVVLDYQKDALILDVADTGKGSSSKEDGQPGGKGLIGMRERAKLLKGEFRAGNAPNGGFRVSAKLPLEEQAK